MGARMLIVSDPLFFSIFLLQDIDAQNVTPTDAGALSGNLQANGNFYIRDSTIGAANIRDRRKH